MLSVTDHGCVLVLPTDQRAERLRSEHRVRLFGSRELCASRLSHGSEGSLSLEDYLRESVRLVLS